jgi:hypothetical protein
MLPLFVPPLVAGALGVLGTVALAKLVAREWRRVNAELHPDDDGRDVLPRLRRDPDTGVFRPEVHRHDRGGPASP